MDTKTIKPGSIAHRTVTLDRAAANEDARTVELAFSSETPVERMWGVEILDHAPESVRLDRLSNGGPLLMDHETRDHVGVIESARIDNDRVGRAVVRFGRSQRADEVFRDVLDGIRRHISVGYVINRATLEETRGDQEVYRVTDWQPFEVSIVSVPADASVGIGRAADTGDSIEFTAPATAGEDDEAATAEPDTPDTTEPHQESRAMDINVEELRAEARKDEQKRVADLLAMGGQFAHIEGDKLAREAVAAGATAEQFRATLLEKLGKTPVPTADIGLTKKEARSFSFVRAIAALSATGADARRAREQAAFELECSQAVAEKMGRDAHGIFVPNEVQHRDLEKTTANSSTGGKLVGTELLSASFIDLLRNRMSIMGAGAQMLSGLVGDIAIPRHTGAASAYWVAESGSQTESEAAFDQVTMTPKTVGAFTDISRKLLRQASIDVEAFVRNDLATVLALELDRAALNGSGLSNQPTGVLQTSGIGSVVGGTNGAAPTWAHIVELWAKVAAANADFGNTGFITNSKVVGKLMTTEKATGTAQFVCPGFPDASGITSFGGARAIVSNQVPSNLTKGTASGVASAIAFGNWADLIVGMWGALDLTVDPYTHSTSGTVRVVALQDADVAVRHAESFAAMLDALTA